LSDAVSIQRGLKKGYALSPLHSNSALAYTSITLLKYKGGLSWV